TGSLLVALREERVELLFVVRPEQDYGLALRSDDEDHLVSKRRGNVVVPVEGFACKLMLDRADEAVTHARDTIENALCVLPLRRPGVGRDAGVDQGVSGREARRLGDLRRSGPTAGGERGHRRHRGGECEAECHFPHAIGPRYRRLEDAASLILRALRTL